MVCNNSSAATTANMLRIEPARQVQVQAPVLGLCSYPAAALCNDHNVQPVDVRFGGPESSPQTEKPPEKTAFRRGRSQLRNYIAVGDGDT